VLAKITSANIHALLGTRVDVLWRWWARRLPTQLRARHWLRAGSSADYLSRVSNHFGGNGRVEGKPILRLPAFDSLEQVLFA